MNPSPAVALLSFVLLSLAAPATGQQRVLVMADPATGEPVVAALRVELASWRAEVIAAPPPAGETRVSRAASAQASAQLAGAIAAVWPDTLESAAGPIPVVRVAPSADSDARQAPLGAEAAQDPRAFALVAASLLEEVLGPPDPPIAQTEIDIQARAGGVDVQVRMPAEAAVPQSYVAEPSIEPTAPAAVPESEPALSASAPAVRDEGSIAVFGGAGLVIAGVFSTFHKDPLLAVRGHVGFRLGLLRLGLEQDFGFTIEPPNFGDEPHAFFRVGITGGVELPVEQWRVIVSGHARLIGSETWTDGFAGDGTSIGPVFDWHWGASLGARGTFAIPLEPGLDLELGVELDVMRRTLDWSFSPAAVAGVTWR